MYLEKNKLKLVSKMQACLVLLPSNLARSENKQACSIPLLGLNWGKVGEILPPFQIIRYFDFSRYIDFTMYLDIVYITVHIKSYIYRKTKMSYNLEWKG